MPFELSRSGRRTTLFSALLLAGLALTTPIPAFAAAKTWVVSTCADNGSAITTAGTLRYSVAQAASGDTIDMSALSCSVISLQTGAISIAQASLTLNGPGAANLQISGKAAHQDRILNHQGTGTLTVQNIGVEYGYVQTQNAVAAGGCILSKGSVSLTSASVTHCEANASGNEAIGGGVFAANALTTKYSTLSSNVVNGAPGLNIGFAGAAFAGGNFTSKYSTIQNNATNGHGGGLFLQGSVTVRGSTISGNSALHFAGGMAAVNSTSPIKFINSTISGNSSGAYVGGLYTNARSIAVDNSTIAFNTAAKDFINESYQGPQSTYYRNIYLAAGLAVSTYTYAASVTLQSSIFSNNSVLGVADYDLSVETVGNNISTITGANNQVRRFPTASRAHLPTDTLRVCPYLLPLRNNGGPTKTHALSSHSPAIDAGNNSANLTQDQRGVAADSTPYAYPRVSGIDADIGAYEVQQADIIFNAGLDGCG